MTTSTIAKPQAKPSARNGRRFSLPVLLLIIAGVLVLTSVVRLITGANEITSTGQVSTALRLAVPIGLAGLGGLWAERAGVVNIGLEGMMILGTWFGAWAGYQWGPWTGVIFGIIGGCIGAVLHAIATVTFNVNHIVSGVAINILALGLTRYLSKFTFEDAPQGSSKQSPPIDSLGTFSVPGLSDALQTLNGKHWFLVSDLAGLIGGVFTNLSPLTVVAVALVPLSWWVLWRTAFGLRLRSCGENPVAAESLGVNVYLYKYLAVIISGGFAGLGGAFLSIVASNVYLDGQTAGRGYIGLAAMIFGNWMPGGLALGAGLFGYTDSLNLRGGTTNVHALILLLAILLVFGVAYLVWRKRIVPAVITAVVSALMFLWYAGTDDVPKQVVTATPYLVTLLVLSLSAQHLRMPKADGLPYRKGQGK
ncbi:MULTISPECIES: ABC transporter permease [Streptomyces]|uniref:ABC transporter permease n=1 Tax=Streptomyces thermoviolaceus subsp. thermoviolaceus TaxID=66860 RepID=A0ABX0YQP5_STRTL|nr:MULTISPECIES: ABC transporter permease [Streptomyces]MCM3263790.1 ABC transporter permease [Streptomyces thermoviolaceus]NJP14709.1 ABC transporter permease [Streptomyces thermoviolaceus subsp. thermoviolaceus]RSS07459.1 ABC transporter permease [Streptomyces sp. WAC00469]WTD47748.1 ABC transporter permease [Streptomyces thermoviolaceus]GGV75029.1 ABC transporter permease [Streptomyces thermoviolaceus subsp. apingens]